MSGSGRGSAKNWWSRCSAVSAQPSAAVFEDALGACPCATSDPARALGPTASQALAPPLTAHRARRSRAAVAVAVPVAVAGRAVGEPFRLTKRNLTESVDRPASVGLDTRACHESRCYLVLDWWRP